jgi:hypothetical protein
MIDRGADRKDVRKEKLPMRHAFCIIGNRYSTCPSNGSPPRWYRFGTVSIRNRNPEASVVASGHVDFRSADVLGSRPSLDLFSGDTRMPLNINDEDIHPDMANPPLERNTITSTTLCLIRYEIIESLRNFATADSRDVGWEVLSSPDVALTKKDRAISQLEDHWERKYLRYCDPSNSLHTFISIIIRSNICKMKLFAHNPRQFANSTAKVPQRERDIVFANAIKLLEYITLLQEGGHGLDKYMWQIGTSYLWNAMLYVLIEARHRKAGPEMERLWQLIGRVFSYYPQVFEESTGTVYRALRKWTLEVWDAYITSSKTENLPESSTPEYIIAIQRCRRRSTEYTSKSQDLEVDSEAITRNTDGSNQVLLPAFESNLPGLGAFEPHQYSNLSSVEMDPNAWLQWEQLVADESVFAHADGVEDG